MIMDIIKLDEVAKFKWIIKYTILVQDEFVILAEGPIFDFIPNENDYIRINEKTYKVLMKTFDFDHSVIWISLFDDTQKNA